LASELVENRSFFKPIEEMKFLINEVIELVSEIKRGKKYPDLNARE